MLEEIKLRDRLPTLAIPLRQGQAEVSIDLQAALDITYDTSAYELEIDYTKPPKVSLEDSDAKWAEALLRKLRRSTY